MQTLNFNIQEIISAFWKNLLTAVYIIILKEQMLRHSNNTEKCKLK